MNDMWIILALLLFLTFGLFAFYKRYHFLKSEEAAKKFSPIEIRNAKIFIGTGAILSLPLIAFLVYRMIILF